MQSSSNGLQARGRKLPTVALASPISIESHTNGEVGDDDPVPSEYESTAEDDQTPAPRHTLFTEDPFSNETSKILFESIDELRRWGAGQDLDIPQLVIVGKQSAGKSSLLQSLTDIPFPVGARLCTRFATRIVSIRTPLGTSDVVKASIEPRDINPFQYVPDQALLDGFEQVIPSMTAETFDNLIDKAKEVMGINSSRGPRNQNFSSLVLKIELSGPKRSHFDILDVPGIFSATTRDDIQKHEMEGVTAMVSSYMKTKENIIICVAEAGDIANEQILTLAKDLDVDSSRIVGVFTKCDLSQDPESIVDIVKEGEGIPGKILRWHVVRNRGSKSPANFDRDQEEMTIFSKSPWRQIPPAQRGTPMLRKYLADLLCRRIREAFPNMKDTLEKLLHGERIIRKSLGDPRAKKDQRRNFLIGIVKDFQDLAKSALHSSGDLPSDDMKLRSIIKNQNEEFSQTLKAEGQFYKFLEIGEPIETEFTVNGSSPARRQRQIAPIYQEIRSKIVHNRGEELPGMLNPAVLKPLWKKQTSKWQTIGDLHLEAIIKSTRTVSLSLFDLATANKKMTARARQKLEAIIIAFAERGRTTVKQQLEEVCTMNATMAMQTTDKRFDEKVRNARDQRFRQALGRFWITHPTSEFVKKIPQVKDHRGATEAEIAAFCEKWIVVQQDDIADLFNEIHPQGSRSQNVEDEIHDILRSYYEIEIENFSAHVQKHIVEPFLESSTGPLFGLSTDYVMNLTDDEIDELGGEDETIVTSRKACESKISRLEEAMRIADRAWRETRGGLD